MTGKKYKPTQRGIKVLCDLVDGRDPTAGLRTMSDHGGYSSTLAALRRHGLLDARDALTDDGRQAVKAWRSRA